jgi:methylenetetrahydrofolate--tRNA-(uracil-5-)-methyltransferase
MEINIVGGGLAGAEVAYQIARRGIDVVLYEMRPYVFTPAHKTACLAELVCSNSMKSKELGNAHGLLKEELNILDSLVIRVARETAIPGGKALVVDREKFAQRITGEIESNAHIRVVREEVKEIPPGTVIIATGPLTSSKLAEKIGALTGEKNLYFYDAISPVIDAESVDMGKAFYASRYTEEKNDDYLNCPLTEEEYNLFYDELISAGRVEFKEFEKTSYFEGCLPIEVMAERGRQTLLYGPMKPVGLIDEHTGKRPFAVIQLRKENAGGTMFNLVGFQTKLTYQEQDRVLRFIPALKNALFLRYGSVHRNTYIQSPAVLNESLQLKKNGNIFFAGQITGVEGYVESTAMGLVAGLSVHAYERGKTFMPPPQDTCVGALLRYITTETTNFQPMNVNFGLFKDYRKREKEKAVHRALESIALWKKTIDEGMHQ